MIIPLSLLTAALLTGAQASNVIDLVPSNFDSVVGNGKPGLVEFFAPWCGHCKNLAPTYEQLADAYAHAQDKVVIAKVDADGEGRPLGQKFGVTGFPTIKWFDANGGEPETYEGARDLDALVAFVTKMSGVKSKIKPPPPPATLTLTTRDFNEVVLDKSKNVLVAFTAPWCGHCKKMKPEYEKVAETFLPESDCVLANVDADADVNAPLAKKYSITSFPTLYYFPKGNKFGEPYEGGRTEADFVEFLNEKCGTNRAVGGGLNEFAGRVPELDSLASKFFSAAADARHSVYEEANSLADTVGASSQHYLRVMQKVVNGTEDYITKESARLASILKKRTLSAAKLDEIKIKANILATFAEQKAQEMKEAAEDVAEDATDGAKEGMKTAADHVESAAKKVKEEL